MIFIATKIIVGIHVLVYFGTSLVVCNEDIPFCDKRLKELRKDEKDWSERCLNGEGENLVTPSCEAKKEYNHERMCVYTKICFYKGPYAEPYLLIKSKSEIHAIDLTTLDTTVIIGGIAGRTMDIDTVDNKLYIADNNSISRVNLDDICVEVILQNVSVRDMAIDLLRSSRRIFWTEYLEKQIFVADLGDKKKRVLMKTTNYPSRIAFDAKLKYLFWTEPIAKFVRRINLVSNDIVTFASRKFSKSYAIAVDCTKKRVYWLENEIQSGVHHIFSSDYYGYDQKSIVSGSLNDYLLGVFGGSLYYLNNDLFSINEMNVCNGTISRNILVDNNTYYDDLVVVHSSIQPQERLGEL
ncbi:Hypothetical predicted protein [Paramuricea clavata]|uniref:Uncharacterized protein n=1 Tax=Paramuricea clavata TaxID=317549 RepID=A0A7D9JWB6_PARCT|nr:Hypothetical predicted protein [Paramuricea clavata]